MICLVLSSWDSDSGKSGYKVNVQHPKGAVGTYSGFKADRLLVVVMMASTAALAFGGGMKDFGPKMDFDCSGSTRMVPRQGLQSCLLYTSDAADE